MTGYGTEDDYIAHIPGITGAELLRLRKERNLTQREIAHRAGIPNGTYRAYELGNNMMPIPRLFRLSEEFDVPAADIINVVQQRLREHFEDDNMDEDEEFV